MKYMVVLGAISLGMFFLGFYWGYLFGELNKMEEEDGNEHNC
jgi:hypothetical protein